MGDPEYRSIGQEEAPAKGMVGRYASRQEKASGSREGLEHQVW